MEFQRKALAPKQRASTDRLWQPDDLGGLRKNRNLEPEPGDLYVVVDERIEGFVTLALAPWPHLDRAGRLRFRSLPRGLPDEISLRETELARLANAHRQRDGKLKREIRIGDAFLARGLEAGPPVRSERFVDVTRGAREAAKIALNAALTPQVSEERAQQLDMAPQAAAAPAPPLSAPADHTVRSDL